MCIKEVWIQKLFYTVNVRKGFWPKQQIDLDHRINMCTNKGRKGDCSKNILCWEFSSANSSHQLTTQSFQFAGLDLAKFPPNFSIFYPLITT